MLASWHGLVGDVTGFQPPGSVDFHHTIHVTLLRATIDTHMHQCDR